AIAGNSREAQTGTYTSYEEPVIVSTGERICSSDKEKQRVHHRHPLVGHLHSVVKHLLPTQKRKSLT
ncbi:hypothetical protein PROFUN_01791, partial [Planoprotostelium fungivorum]